MADAERGYASNVLPLPRWTILIHGIQIFLGIIILGLSSYGVHFVPYNALIYSLVVCICTFGVAAYIIAASLSLQTFYNKYVVLGLHVWMIIFWIVDLGLVANLARLWSTYDDLTYGYYSYYGYYYKRDLSSLAKRDIEFTTYETYYGCLAAGAFFGAVEFVLWIVTLVMVILYINKQRTGALPPPAYAQNGQNVVMETKPQHSQPQYQQPQQPQQYTGAPAPQQPYAQQPFVQQPQQAYNQPQYTYQDPVNRDATVSPVSQAPYTPAPTHSDLVSPQHTGGYNPTASELSSHR